MDLRSFVDALGKDGALLRVDRPVDPKFEISGVVKALRGRAVLFEKVKGHDMPVVSNVCATRDQVCQALGVDKRQLLSHIAHAIDHPKTARRVPASDYVEIAPDLLKIPILTHYREDGGPYVASGIAIARDPEYGLNASFHRAMVRNSSELGLRIVERHLHAFMGRGLREFAFCIGNPVSVLIAAALSIEIGRDELQIAAALDDSPLVELDGLVVPPAEIVMRCEVTGRNEDEGPFVDLTETFDIVRKQPVVKVTKIYVRKNPMFHALLPGDLEHKTLMGMPREPTIFRSVSKVCECLDVVLTPGGCSWLHGVVKIRKHSPDDGKRAIEAAFAGHPSMKHVYVVDEDIDIENPAEVEWAMATRFQGDRDLVVKPKQKGSSLDPSSNLATKETTKIGFDLTIPEASRTPEFKRAVEPLTIKLEDYV